MKLLAMSDLGLIQDVPFKLADLLLHKNVTYIDAFVKYPRASVSLPSSSRACPTLFHIFALFRVNLRDSE